VITVDGNVAAFAIGEKLNENTYVDHFERADTKFPGIYQFLLHEFVKHIPKEFKFVNREQDLGIEGLRKAKTDLGPIHMIEKYLIKK